MSESPAIVLLILGTFGVSLWGFDRPHVQERLIFRPENILAGKEYYRLLTSGFLHAGWGHLLLNMYTLSGFGSVIAWSYGHGSFVLIYLGSIVGGNLLSLYVHRHHDYSAYGASGGVCGIIFAYVLKYPYSRMPLFPLPYTVPAWLYAVAFVVASFYAMKAQRDQIGHDAHLGGAIVGLFISAGLDPVSAMRNWMVFLALVLIASLLFAYLLINPLFLPLAAFRSGSGKGAKARLTVKSARRPPVIQQPARPQLPLRLPSQPEVDWLFGEIEAQVGRLQKDDSGRHAWIDKFGRTYDLLRATPASFDFAAFRQTLTERLKDTSVNFIIVDTRLLSDNQEAVLRPWIADLPEDQFYRILRSYAFKRPGLE